LIVQNTTRDCAPQYVHPSLTNIILYTTLHPTHCLDSPFPLALALALCRSSRFLHPPYVNSNAGQISFGGGDGDGNDAVQPVVVWVPCLKLDACV